LKQLFRVKSLLEETLVNWRGHRLLILEAIARHTPSAP